MSRLAHIALFGCGLWLAAALSASAGPGDLSERPAVASMTGKSMPSLQRRGLASPQIAVLIDDIVPTAWECRMDGRIRHVVVDYAALPAPVPCGVYYQRDAYHEGEVLWSSAATRGYCEAKADGLVGRLERSGWSCAGRAVAY